MSRGYCSCHCAVRACQLMCELSHDSNGSSRHEGALGRTRLVSVERSSAERGWSCGQDLNDQRVRLLRLFQSPSRTRRARIR